MFTLCYKGKTNDGKYEIYPIYESSLKNIDMYTSYKYCSSKTEMFRLLPADVRDFILYKFAENNYSDIKGDFFVRKSCLDIRKGRTDLEVLYNYNSDIVFSDKNDIYFAFDKIKLNKGDNEFDIKIKKKFFKELYDMVLSKETKLLGMIDVNNEKNDLFERYSSRLESVAASQSNLRLISDYIFNNYELKRKTLLLLKKYKSYLEFTDYKKVSLVNEVVLNSRIKNRPFSIARALLNMKKILSYETKKIEKKSNTLISSEEKKGAIHEDDIDYQVLYKDENKEDFDDFLGPKEANDKRYWSIN